MLKFKTHINNKNNDWVTFLHGFGGSSNIWHKQVRELSKYHNLLFIDLFFINLNTLIRFFKFNKNFYLKAQYGFLKLSNKKKNYLKIYSSETKDRNKEIIQKKLNSLIKIK